jgi:UDP-glucose 4-epimerase
MRILVSGGAGYIGSITADYLLRHGHAVRILDDLSTGHREALPAGAEFVEARVQDRPKLDEALHDIDAVIHFASLSLVGESIAQPERYHRENVGAATALIEAMRDAQVNRMVFSSSAAVYGDVDVDVIDESQPLAPINPYGETKQLVEAALRAECDAGWLGAICLRYFNACGAVGSRGEDHDPETHLIPRLLAAMRGEAEFMIYGDDYATPDGTAIRDYVHVEDLARAHALSIEAIARGRAESINLGTGDGNSVREIVEAASLVTGRDFHAAIGPRRAGDPARLVASNRLAAERLDWKPEASSPERILGDAWRWHREHPSGY